MRFFFIFHFGFSANMERFKPAMLRSRPCASRKEFTYSPRCIQCKNTFFDLRSSNCCPLAESDKQNLEYFLIRKCPIFD